MGSLGMGPAIKNNNIISFLGAKGGVGCTTLSCLLARIIAKKNKTKVALIDGSTYSFSPTPSYLSIPSPSHHLFQLQPYQDHLTSKMIQNYFSMSPEGLAYIPLRQIDDGELSFSQIFSLIQKIAEGFDCLIIDLSSFPSDQYLHFAENSSRFFFISSSEASSLTAIKQWEKRLMASHFELDSFGIIFNQTNQSQPIPKDIASWSKHLNHISSVPFVGENLSIQLIETNTLNSQLEKVMETLANKVLPKNFSSSLETSNATPSKTMSSSEEFTDISEPVFLAQINELHQKLLEHLRKSGALKDQKVSDVSQRQALEPNAREILDQLIQEMKISNREIRQKLVSETLNLAFGLGPLEHLLQNQEITEIMVNGHQHIYVEKKGLIEKTNTRFLNDQQLRTVIERILAPIGRRIDESQPYVDGRLSDGSRINAVIPPLSLNGPVLTIRKFSKRKLLVEDLVKFGSLTQEAADFLGASVRAKKNIIVSGGTGSGKTTLLNILSNFIPSNERIVTIEDSAELQLSQEHVVRLESRPANLEGKGQVAIRDLVINALRMRPDRIVVGECRGGEALDMLQAMNTGHDGSLTTAHANSPRDVLSRLETMVLFTGLELPLKAIREQIARSVHLVVQQSRLHSGKRSVTQISEIQGMEGDVIITQDIFSFDEEKGLVRRPFAPSFITDLNSIGYNWPGHNEKIKN